MGQEDLTALDLELEHDRVELVDDRSTGLRGVIAIHSRALGPAMGGLRLHAYPNLEAAIVDALRLSHAMTLKNSAAGLELGGGKAVLIDDGHWGDPELRDARMRALGRRIDRLEGEYMTAEDVGTTPSDMAVIGRETRWVAGRPKADGGRGDPSASTARTVLSAIRAGVQVKFLSESLQGIRVGVLGTGNVGARLARMLSEAGAELTVADVHAERASRVAAEVGGAVVTPTELISADIDVIAPCALGGAIKEDHVDRIRAGVIAGAANNQLADPAIATDLDAAGILYVPDFIANSGGIIEVGGEMLKLQDDEIERRLTEAELRIFATLAEAMDAGHTPWEVALEKARQRVATATGPTLARAGAH